MVAVKSDEFWDYDKQVDLEGFSAPVLYDTLARQSRQVTQTLGKQKDEVKSHFKRSPFNRMINMYIKGKHDLGNSRE